MLDAAEHERFCERAASDAPRNAVIPPSARNSIQPRMDEVLTRWRLEA
jgi:hypothetical protein